jgi:hypothetical protein
MKKEVLSKRMNAESRRSTIVVSIIGFPGFPNGEHRKARRLELAFVQHTNNSPLVDLIIRTISIVLKEETFQFTHRRKNCQLSSRQQAVKTGMQCNRFPTTKNVNESPRSEF